MFPSTDLKRFDLKDSPMDGLDPVYEEILGQELSSWPSKTDTNLTIPVKVYERDESFVIRADLHGLRSEDIEIVLSESSLKIKGEFPQDEECAQEMEFSQVRFPNKFLRIISLPEHLARSEMQTSFRDGVLKVTFPKTP